jgi:acyl-CoA dehydrogenase
MEKPMIEFQLSDTDREILDYVREEALVVRKYAREWDDRESELPPNELPEAKDYPGVERLLAKRGDNGDTSRAVLEMLLTAARSWGDYSVSIRRGKSGLGNAALLGAGTPEQIKKWNGMFLAMAITEPGCGSDPSMVETTAKLDGDEWVLNGEKIFVTGGIRCQGVVAWATVDKSAGRAGIKSFLIEKGAPGFVIAHKEKKLGIRADDTAALVFQDCRIPRENLLGLQEDVPRSGGSGGFRDVLKTFNLTRPGVSARGLGMAQAALDFTREQLTAAGYDLSYGQSRRTVPAVVESFHRLEALWEASMLTVLHAAWLAGAEKTNNLESSVCKAKSGAAIRQITQGCIEILGPLGVSQENLLEKWFRDVRITDIYEGTQQIQHLIIARAILGYGRKELS